jgi:hypothetical protein
VFLGGHRKKQYLGSAFMILDQTSPRPSLPQHPNATFPMRNYETVVVWESADPAAASRAISETLQPIERPTDQHEAPLILTTGKKRQNGILNTTCGHTRASACPLILVERTEFLRLMSFLSGNASTSLRNNKPKP